MATDPITLTRRALFTVGGLMAASFALPPVPDEPGKFYLFGPTEAAAEDKIQTFSVNIASETTIQFKVFDVAKNITNASDPGVEGVFIKVTPLEEKVKDLPATTIVTDSNGFAMMDIGAYCPEVNEDAPRYQCAVMIEIRKDGHKPTKIYQRLVTGATLYALPCPSMSESEEKRPHFRAVGFAGWDVQYTNNTFLYSKIKSNYINITVQVRVDEDPNDVSVEFWRWHASDAEVKKGEFKPTEKEGERTRLGVKNIGKSGKRCDSASDTADEKKVTEKYWEVSIREPYLNSAYNLSFASTDDRLVVRVVSKKYGSSGIITYAEFAPMPFTAAKQGDISPFPSLTDGTFNMDIPGVNPLVGEGNGMHITFDTPKWPFFFMGSPHGYAMVGGGTAKRFASKYNAQTGKVEKWFGDCPRNTAKLGYAELTGLWKGRFKEQYDVLGTEKLTTGINKVLGINFEAANVNGVNQNVRVDGDRLVLDNGVRAGDEENDDRADNAGDNVNKVSDVTRLKGDNSAYHMAGDSNVSGSVASAAIGRNGLFKLVDGEGEGGLDDWEQLGKNLIADNDNDDVLKKGFRWIPRLYLMIAAQAYLDATLDRDSKTRTWNRWIGGINVVGGATGSFSYNFLFAVGAVPCYFEVALSGSAYGFFRAAFSLPYSDSDVASVFDGFFSNATFENESSRLGAMLSVGISGAIAAGVQNCCNIGFRGGVNISFCFSLWEQALLAQDKLPFRFKVNLGASASFFVQLLLFHFTYDFVKVNKTLYDSAEAYEKQSAFKGATTSSLFESAFTNDSSGYQGRSLPAELNLRDARLMSTATESGEEAAAYRDKFKDGISLATLAEIADKGREAMQEDEFLGFAAVTAEQFESVCEYEVSAESGASLSALDDDGYELQPEFETIDNGNGSFTFVRTYPDLVANDAEGGISVASLGDDDSDSGALSDTGSADDELSNLPAGWKQMPVSADPGYSYESTGDKLVGGGSGTSSLSGIGDEGVKCTSAQILEKVYCDGRPKFVRVSGIDASGKSATKTAMFRISTVKYGETYLPRLSVQYKNDGAWSKVRPIDFKLPTSLESEGITRATLSDYDFDVDEFSIKGKDGSERHYVAISLLSGVLESNQNIGFEEVATKPVTSVLIFGPQMGYNPDDSAAVANTWRYAPVVREAISWMTLGNENGMKTYGGQKYLTYAPVVSAQASTANSRDVSTIVISGAYLYRQVAENATKNKIFSDDTKSQIRIFTTSTSVSTYTWNDTIAELFNAQGLLNTGLNLTDGPAEGVESLSSGVTNVCMGENEWTWYADTFFGYSANESSGIFGVHHEREYKNGFTDYSSGNVYRAGDKDASKICYPLDSKVKRLRLWNGHNAFFALKSVGSGDDEHKELNVFKLPTPNKDKSYTERLIDKAITDAGLVGAEESTPVEFFVTNDGGMLLYHENSQPDEGETIPIVDGCGSFAEGNLKATYRIKALRAIESEGKTLFTKPFVLAECDTPIDGIVATAAADEATDIMYMHITEFKLSQAEYRYVTIPCVAAATPTSFVADEDYATAGKECTFKLELRNDGNTLLYGAHVSLLDGDDNNKVLVNELEIKFSKENIVCTSDAKADESDETATKVLFESGYSDSNHILAKDDGLNVVAPGKSARVKFTYKIPDDWSGTRNIVVKTNKISYANPITGETATTASLMSLGEDGAPSFASAASLSDLASGTETKQEEVGTQEQDIKARVTTISGLATIEDLGNRVEFTEVDDNASNNGSGGSNGGSNGSSNGTSGANGKSGKAGMPDTGDLMGMASLAAGALGAGMVAYSKRRAQVAAEEAAAKAEQNASVDEPADEA